MGIATTTSRINVEALLRVHLGPRWADAFAVIVCGEDVEQKKPDPEVYAECLRALGIGPLEAVAIEDAPGGVAAVRTLKRATGPLQLKSVPTSAWPMMPGCMPTGCCGVVGTRMMPRKGGPGTSVAFSVFSSVPAS